MTEVARRYTDDVPEHLEARVRELCLELPDAYEERAWVGTRWMVRKRTFALVLGRGRDALGIVLDPDTDWDEVRELMTESFCVMDPKKLAALVDRPDDGARPERGPDRL